MNFVAIPLRLVSNLKSCIPLPSTDSIIEGMRLLERYYHLSSRARDSREELRVEWTDFGSELLVPKMKEIEDIKLSFDRNNIRYPNKSDFRNGIKSLSHIRAITYNVLMEGYSTEQIINGIILGTGYHVKINLIPSLIRYYEGLIYEDRVIERIPKSDYTIYSKRFYEMKAAIPKLKDLRREETLKLANIIEGMDWTSIFDMILMRDYIYPKVKVYMRMYDLGMRAIVRKQMNELKRQYAPGGPMCKMLADESMNTLEGLG